MFVYACSHKVQCIMYGNYSVNLQYKNIFHNYLSHKQSGIVKYCKEATEKAGDV